MSSSPPGSPTARFGEEHWSRFLSAELERPVRVSFGRARRQVIVARTVGRHLRVRMNAFFDEAPEDVRAATARWLRSGRRARRACEVLDAWIAAAVERRPADAASLPRPRPQGRVHDLSPLATELLEHHFAAPPDALPEPPAITWGRRGRARRSLQLGSFDPEHHLVRVHPVLDQPAVPRFFVRYVLFHELLHAAVREERTRGGRAVHHGPRFRAREEAYPDYERALAWQEENLAALLRSARSGRDMSGRSEPAGAEPAQGWLFPC